MKQIWIIWVLLIVSSCATQEMLAVREMQIKDVDLRSLADGDYVGAFSYGGFEYRVKTVVKERRIVDVVVLQNRDTDYAKEAEGVLPEMVKRQTPNVDAISGATTTSKALMKAVENALISGPVKAR